MVLESLLGFLEIWLEATCTLTNEQAFAMDLVGPACIVAESFDAAVQVNEERLQKGLPSVQSLQRLDNSKWMTLNTVFFLFN